MSEAILGVPQFNNSGGMDFVNATNIECIMHTRLNHQSTTTISLKSTHSVVIANVFFDSDNGPYNILLYPGDTKNVLFVYGNSSSDDENIQISLDSTGKTITAYKPSQYGIIKVGATGF